MSDQRRALCCELAEVDRMIDDLQQALIPYKHDEAPGWGDVEALRNLKSNLDIQVKRLIDVG